MVADFPPCSCVFPAKNPTRIFKKLLWLPYARVWSSHAMTQFPRRSRARGPTCASVSRGACQASPYASLNIDNVLSNLQSQFHLTVGRVRAAAFDLERGLLYVTEFIGDEDK